ncbi:MAG TPA: type II and III secretion system protein, partial [Candidatus Saccharimonadia bacterium]|nr:type II and III secretion system protein [Candidatus Saccharimonadia bacterium]
MAEALRYVAELAGMKVRINPPYVEVVPLADVASEKYVRQYKLPLAQLLALKDKARAGTGAGTADPFAPAGTRMIEGEVSDINAFRAQGIPFPEGSMLRYDRDTQTLVVSNTQPN